MAKVDFLIAYGSHTGQAEAISQQLKEKAELLGWTPRFHELNDNEKQVSLFPEHLTLLKFSLSCRKKN